MKYATMIESIAGAALVMGSVNVMASESHGGWYRDSNTGTYVNANAPDYTSTPSMSGVKSKRGSEFANGAAQDSNTGTLTRIDQMKGLEKGQGCPRLPGAGEV